MSERISALKLGVKQKRGIGVIPGVATAVVILTLGVLTFRHLDTETPEFESAGTPASHNTPVAVSASSAQAPAQSILTPASSTPFDLQQALAGTSIADIDIPRSLKADSQGDLIINEGVRELMNVFLTLTGERDPDQIRAMFAAAASEQCPAACAVQALAIYDRYLDYLDALQQASEILRATDNLRARLLYVSQLRTSVLGEDLARDLFAYDDAYDNLRVAQWEIRTNQNLSEQEKMQALEDLKSAQPAELTAREQQNEKMNAVRKLSRQLEEQNIDAGARFAARSELLDEAAAERLQALDESRAQWKQRYEAYRRELVAIDTASLDAVDRESATEQLRLRHFSAQESQRAAALDRIQDRAE